MTLSEKIALYQSYQDEQKDVSVQLEDTSVLHGYIAGVSELGVLMEHINDFHIDGYRFVPHDSVAFVRQSEQEDLYDTIFGLLWHKKLQKIFAPTDIDTFEKIAALMGTQRMISIYTEESGQDWGMITEYNVTTLTFQRYDSMGLIDGPTQSFEWTEIVLMEWDNEYCLAYTTLIHHLSSR